MVAGCVWTMAKVEGGVGGLGGLKESNFRRPRRGLPPGDVLEAVLMVLDGVDKGRVQAAGCRGRRQHRPTNQIFPRHHRAQIDNARCDNMVRAAAVAIASAPTVFFK